MSNGDAGSVTEQAGLVLSVIQDDVKHVQLRATAALAIAAVFVTQIDLKDLRALSGEWGVATVAGIALLVVAGLAYFHYSQLLNRSRLRIAKNMSRSASLSGTVRDSWETPFMSSDSSVPSNPLLYYGVGQGCFVVGGALLLSVVAKLILG
jgi:hypothetical protein